MVIQTDPVGGGQASGRFSYPRAMWTAALAGGAFGTVLASTPVLGNRPYLWYAVGACIAIYVLRQVLKKAGRDLDMSRDLWVAAMSGLLPAVTQWVMLPWVYTTRYLPTVDQAYREALASPHIPREQAEGMHRFWHSAAGPWAAGAQGFVSILVWSALVGLFVEMVVITLTKDRSKGKQES